MANLTQTISNGIGLFGPAPSNKWNALNWNAFLWGEGNTDLAVSFVKVLAETITLADSLAKSAGPVISNSLGSTTDMTYEAVTNGDFFRLFPGGVTSGEERVASTWSAGSASAPSWSQSAASSTSWSGS
jgi:hypothetical protein